MASQASDDTDSATATKRTRHRKARTQPAELLQTTEDIIDVNRPTPVSIDPPYKPVCKLSPEVIEELSNEWEIRIRHDLWNREGYAYKPGGDKRGNACGAFPHGIKEMTTGRLTVSKSTLLRETET